MEFIRRQFHKLDKSSLERLEDPNRRYRPVNPINILHHIFVEKLTNVLNWSTMMVATATLLALILQFLPFHGGQGGDDTAWYALDFRKGTGLDLATVGGLTIRSWGWVDKEGRVHRQLPIFLVPHPTPFSFFYALLPLSTCVAFAIVLVMTIAIVFLTCRAVQNADEPEDMIIPAKCTALCVAGLAGCQVMWLFFGSMRLSTPTLQVESVGKMADQVWNGNSQDRIKIGAGLITGWSSLGGCVIWIMIAYGRYTAWNEYLTNSWDRYRRARRKLAKKATRKGRQQQAMKKTSGDDFNQLVHQEGEGFSNKEKNY